MPIYAYRCESCGHAKDVLQKISDAPLSTCPACGAESFRKQVTAAGFQLKGSGWYVTDFRDGNKGGKPSAKEGDTKDGADRPAADGAAKPAGEGAAAAAATPAAGASSPSAAPAPSSASASPSASSSASPPASPSTTGGSASS